MTARQWRPRRRLSAEEVAPETVDVDLRVNGEIRKVKVAPGATLLRVLRDELGMTGTKEGCGRGECGACTVLVAGRPTLSCITLAARTDVVETIEGLADESAGLRRAFAEEGAFQCGYCTPGQVVRGVALLRERRCLDQGTVAREMNGNICRCTGYAAIIRAVIRSSDEPDEAGGQ